jgi:hypothetical protein
VHRAHRAWTGGLTNSIATAPTRHGDWNRSAVPSLLGRVNEPTPSDGEQ